MARHQQATSSLSFSIRGVSRVIVDGLEVFALPPRSAHAVFVVHPDGDVADDVFDELRVLVGALGDVFLVGALEDAVAPRRRLPTRRCRSVLPATCDHRPWP